MSEELGEMIRAVAREEAAAAAGDSSATQEWVARFVGDIRRRRAAGAAMLAVVALPLAGAAAFGLSHVWQDSPISPAATPSVSWTPSASPSATPSASAVPSPFPTGSPSPSPTAAPTSTTTAPPPPPPPERPVAVSNLVGQPGGGSGEIVLTWGGSPGATGYHVYRASAPGDPMKLAATYTVATGNTTVKWTGAYESIQIWSPSANAFEYVEAVDGQPGYFVVAAFNAVGDGPLQGTVCVVPLGSSGSC